MTLALLINGTPNLQLHVYVYIYAHMALMMLLLTYWLLCSYSKIYILFLSIRFTPYIIKVICFT